MVFCGHCGYQLRSGNTACPRCGAPTEPIIATDEPEADMPTLASNSTLNAPQPMPPQQPLILHSPDGSFGALEQRDAASRVNAPGYANVAPAYNPEVQTPYPHFATQDASHPGFTSQGGVGTSIPGLYGAAPAKTRTRRRGRTIALLLILLVLLLANGAIAFYLFVIRPSTTAPTPSQQAQATLQQFYDDINKRDQQGYQDAYNLLGHAFQQSQSYSDFAGGFAHTRHDDITFDAITPLANGTVKIAMTIHATEDTASGTGVQHSTYKGSYIVGQENGTWKILSGNLNKVA